MRHGETQGKLIDEQWDKSVQNVQTFWGNLQLWIMMFVTPWNIKEKMIISSVNNRMTKTSKDVDH